MRLRSNASRDSFLKFKRISPEELAAKNLFVNCETDEDIAYLTSVLGEGVLCVGTDYGHSDVGAELGAHGAIVRARRVSEPVIDRTVDLNGRALLGVPTGFTPAPALSDKAMPPHVRGLRSDGDAALLVAEYV